MLLFRLITLASGHKHHTKHSMQSFAIASTQQLRRRFKSLWFPAITLGPKAKKRELRKGTRRDMQPINRGASGTKTECGSLKVAQTGKQDSGFTTTFKTISEGEPHRQLDSATFHNSARVSRQNIKAETGQKFNSRSLSTISKFYSKTKFSSNHPKSRKG